MDRRELLEPLKKSEVGVVIVTHNSEASINPTLAALNQQTYPPFQVVLVDSGSSTTHYLKEHSHQGSLEICLMPNIGFSSANNMGISSLDAVIDYVLILNPDVILPDNFIEKALEWMAVDGRTNVGAITGPLWGWDLDKEKPTGLLDSTGIFTTWYGKWYDRGKGLSAKYNPFKKMETLPAICGALMFCRREALISVKLKGSQVFDEEFFCYKEDIDLSLRLRKKGWTLYYVPELIAYHARGWQQDRQKIPKDLREMSALNELKLHLKGYNPIKIFYSTLKWVGVSLFNL